MRDAVREPAPIETFDWTINGSPSGRRARRNLVVTDDGVTSVYILDVNGERQVFLTQ